MSRRLVGNGRLKLKAEATVQASLNRA